MWTECVIDASMGARHGLFTFCPIEGDIDAAWRIVTGMNYVSTDPPEDMRMVAIVHPDGQEAVNQFLVDNKQILDALQERLDQRTIIEA